jgi:hypothetical protein
MKIDPADGGAINSETSESTRNAGQFVATSFPQWGQEEAKFARELACSMSSTLSAIVYSVKD